VKRSLTLGEAEALVARRPGTLRVVARRLAHPGESFSDSARALGIPVSELRLNARLSPRQRDANVQGARGALAAIEAAAGEPLGEGVARRPPGTASGGGGRRAAVRAGWIDRPERT
jgi:hypothetical protein